MRAGSTHEMEMGLPDFDFRKRLVQGLVRDKSIKMICGYHLSAFHTNKGVVCSVFVKNAGFVGLGFGHDSFIARLII